MIVLGLLGGIACGKSTVCKFFEDLQAKVFDADQVARTLFLSPTLQKELQKTFGTKILDEHGHISRQKLADVVFQNPTQLQKLNQIMHPPVFEALQLFLEQCHQENSSELIVVLDIPLLLETGHQHLCDYLVFIDTPQIRREEFAKSRHWSQDELFRRESQQFSLQKKKEISHFILPNHGNKEELRQAVLQLQAQLQKSHSRQNL